MFRALLAHHQGVHSCIKQSLYRNAGNWKCNILRLHLNFGRLRLKCDGTRAETRFRLSAKRASPFKSAGAPVQSTTGSRGVRISGSNAGYTMFQGSVKSTYYPLYSPVSPPDIRDKPSDCQREPSWVSEVWARRRSSCFCPSDRISRTGEYLPARPPCLKCVTNCPWSESDVKKLGVLPVNQGARCSSYVVCPKSSCSAMPWNCASRIRTWGSSCQRSFLRGGFEASEWSCASRATGIVGGEAMDSPPRQCPPALCINHAWVFGAQFHHRARTSPLLAAFSPLRFFSCSPNANWCCGGGIGECDGDWKGNDIAAEDNYCTVK